MRRRRILKWLSSSPLLSWCVPNAIRFDVLLGQREGLSICSLYDQHYRDRGFDEWAVACVLDTIAKELQVDGARLRPEDDLVDAFPDLDIGEMAEEVWSQCFKRHLSAAPHISSSTVDGLICAFCTAVLASCDSDSNRSADI